MELIALSGSLAAGKTTVASLVSTYGYRHVSTRAVLEGVFDVSGASRPQLQELGLKVRSEHGQRWLYERALSGVDPSAKVVLDSLRFREDVTVLEELLGGDFLHVRLQCNARLRRERYVHRGGSLEEFGVAERHPVEAEVAALAPIADITLVNEASLHDLERSVSALLARR